MESEDELVNRKIKIEIDDAEYMDPPPSGSEHQRTGGWSEGSVKSATASSSETDCWNPSAAAMKREPDSQPASGQGIGAEPDSQPASGQGIEAELDNQPASGQRIKTEPVDDSDDDGAADVFVRFQSADNWEGKVDFKCEFSHEPGSSTDFCSSPVDQADSNETDRADLEKDRKGRACDVCNKAFTTAGSLKRHKLNHTGHKPFVCDVCNKAFTTAGILKGHKLIHNDHKQFVCDVCSKAFTQAGNLKNHRLIHTGYKPFVCDMCSKAFTQVSDLKKHKLIHIGYKPFVCDVCSKAFSHARSMKRHRKIIHNLTQNQTYDLMGRVEPQGYHVFIAPI